MISAIGYSKNTFTPFRPQKLGRGKESWLEEVYSETEMVLKLMAEQQASADQTIHRIIFSGAKLEDISAKNTERALMASGVTAGELLFALYPDAELVVCGEECGSVPEGAVGVEAYRVSETTGVLGAWRYRWTLPCKEPQQLDKAVSLGGQVVLIDPQKREEEPVNVLAAENPPDFEQAPPMLSEAAKQALFLLSNGRAYKAKYRASALPKILTHASQVALFHNDRNGYALGVYSHQDPEIDTHLDAYARSRAILLVPFVIPPMIARWDRALLELLRAWDKKEPFPLASDDVALSSKNKDVRETKEKKAALSEEGSSKSQPISSTDTDPIVEAQATNELEKSIESEQSESHKQDEVADLASAEPELPAASMDEFQDDYDFEEDSW